MKKRNYIIFVLLSVILYNCDDKEPVPVTEDTINFRLIDSEPAWSPDGGWIAFYHIDSIESRCGIYLINPEGTKIEQWHEGFAEYPAWSPDGDWITFSEKSQIWIKKIDGESLTQLTFNGKNFFPSWSLDGQRIIFDGRITDEMKFYGIFKMKNDGKEKTLFRYDNNEGDMRMPSWINHSSIIYARCSPLFYSTEIFKMDSNGENEVRLTFNNADDYFPKYSNNRIAFTSKPMDKPHFMIWTMNDDGSNLKLLTDAQAYTCDWSPDGKHIVYTDARLENGRLWIMDADGSNKQQLTFESHFIDF